MLKMILQDFLKQLRLVPSDITFVVDVVFV